MASSTKEAKAFAHAQVGGHLEAESIYQSSYYPLSFQFPFNPDPLVSSNDYTVYDEMRDDDQVKVALSLKKDMLLNAGIAVVCEDEEVREFIENTLDKIGIEGGMEGGWTESLRDIMSVYDYGFSMTEPVFRKPDESESGLWEIKSLKVRPPHSFIFNIDDQGNVKEVEQLGSEKHPIKFDPNFFIHHVYQPEFGNPYGKSDLRAAHPAWKAKKFIFRMAMRYAERFAGSTVVGRYPVNAGKAEIDRLFNILKSIQDNSTLVIPEGAAVEFIQAQKDGSNIYEGIMNMLNMWMARAILIPDLLGVSGSKTAGGSFALGEKHFDLVLNTISNDRLMLSRRLTSKLVRPLVEANFGPGIDCKLEIKPLDAGSETEAMRLWLDAVNGKIFKPQDEEINLLRRRTGFPEGPVERPAPMPTPPGFPPRPGEAPPPSGSPPQEPDEDEEEPRPGSEQEMTKLTPHEFKMDFASLRDFLGRADDSFNRKVSAMLKKMAKSIVDQAKRRGLVEKFKPEQLAQLQPKHQKELNQLLRGHFVELHRETLKRTQKELMPSKKFIEDDILPEEFERVVRSEAFKMTGDLAAEMSKRTNALLFEGMKNGRPISEIARNISANITGYTEGQLRSILRTKNTEVFNSTRKAYFDTDPLASEIIVAYQYSAVMDDATTEVCRRLHGKVYSKDDASFLATVTPPLHWNCRSLLVPVTRFEEHKTSRPIANKTLRNLGGNLIPKENARVSKFIGEPLGEDLVASGTAVRFGDTTIIAPPSQDRRIILIELHAANTSMDAPVIVGFRSDSDSEVKFRKTLPPDGGVLEKDFSPAGLPLQAGMPLMINLSAEIGIDWTVQYRIESSSEDLRINKNKSSK